MDVQTENEVRQWVELFIKDSSARKYAAAKLGFIGIRYRKERKDSSSVRGNLARAASSVVPKISFLKFLDALFMDKREDVQCEAIFALGELAGEEIVEPLLKYIQSAPADSDLHTAIISSLSKIGGSSVESLLRQFPEDTDAVRGIVSLVAQQKAEDPLFARTFDPRKTVRSDNERSNLVSELREWLIHISEKHQEDYLGLLVAQVL